MIRTDEVIELGKLALAFGRVNRATFHEDGVTPESDTDHTTMLGLIAINLAGAYRYEGVEPSAVAEFALVHDLVEAKCGDTDSFDMTPEGREAKKKREDEAFLDLCEEFGSTSRMMSTLHFYEEQKHPAARFVRYLDKALPKLTHILNGCAAIKAKGHNREYLHAVHQAQLRRLSEQYPEFNGTPLQALMNDLMHRAEVAMTQTEVILPDDPRVQPDWDTECEVCGQKPVMPLTGMCGPCTTGEASTLGGNW